jgi:hypothetical protein
VVYYAILLMYRMCERSQSLVYRFERHPAAPAGYLVQRPEDR